MQVDWVGTSLLLYPGPTKTGLGMNLCPSLPQQSHYKDVAVQSLWCWIQTRYHKNITEVQTIATPAKSPRELRLQDLIGLLFSTLYIWGMFPTSNRIPIVQVNFIWAILIWCGVPSLAIIHKERKVDWSLLMLILFYFCLFKCLPLWHYVLLPILEKLLTSPGKKSGQQKMEQFLKENLGWVNKCIVLSFKM